MASLTSAAVSLYPSFAQGGQTLAEYYIGGVRPRARLSRSLNLVLTGQGGQTNTISAAALGFSKLTSSSALWDATNSKGYPTVVDPVNNILILLSGADPQAPIDVTSSAAYVTVTGIPFLVPTAPV